MHEHDVFDVLEAFSRAAIPAILEGGWAIDALIGHQTRDHRDLDLVVDRDDLPAAAAVLADMGFTHDAERRPGLPAQLIMVDRSGREVDVHPILVDDARNGWQDLRLLREHFNVSIHPACYRRTSRSSQDGPPEGSLGTHRAIGTSTSPATSK